MNTPKSAEQPLSAQPAAAVAARGAAPSALDQRPAALAQLHRQQQADSSPGALQRRARAAQVSGSPRLAAPAQRPAALPDAARSAAPVQRVSFVKKGDVKRQEADDDYELQEGEEYDYDAEQEYYEAQDALEERTRLEAIEAARVERERLAQVERERLAEVEQQRLDRERGLARIPLAVTRRDTNFANVTNRHGQGKAHLTAEGLAPAGDTRISSAEQLDQQSTNKGTSDLISFTGPRPIEGGQTYGNGSARTMTLKMRKLARARAKGKLDAQHLDVITSADLLADRTISRDNRLSGYARRDDEHQVRVGLRDDGTRAIPRRFIHSPGLVDEAHDSDSDEES